MAARSAKPLTLMTFLRPHSRSLVLVIGMLCALAFVDMLAPWFLKILVDEVFVPGADGGDWNLLWLVLPGMGLVYVSRNTLFFASRMRSARVGEDVAFSMRRRLFDHLQRLSLGFYRANRAGKVSARLMDDTFRIQSFIQEKLPTLVRYLIELHVLLVIIYLVNWRLAIVSTIVLPLHLWTWHRFRGPIRRTSSEAQENLATAHGNIVEVFLGMEVVKGFGAEERESRTFNDAIDASRRSTLRSQRFHFAQKVVADLLVGVGTVLLLGYGAWEVRQGRMTGGAFFMYFWYMRMLYPAVIEVIGGAAHLSRTSASVDRVFEMLREPHEHRAASGLADAVEGAIELDGICVTMDGKEVLHDISLTIEPGERVAIVGPSGAGKSTLLNLLPRLVEPTAGTLRVAGRDAGTYDPRSLRTLFGIAFQDVFMFDSSVRENLRYARPLASEEDLVAACRLTGAHDFIEALPGGYDARIGANGCTLSRGQLQRLAIARAIVRDPRILLLDEAVASIDPVTAHAIIARILHRYPDRTVIVVTHDPGIQSLLDRRIVLDHGRVVHDRSDRDQGSTNPMRLRIGMTASALRPLALLACAVLMVGCSSETKTRGGFSMGEPRVAGGRFVETDRRLSLDELAAAIDNVMNEPVMVADRTFEVAEFEAASRPIGLAAAPTSSMPFQEAAAATAPVVPSAAVRLMQLPVVSEIELDEIIERLALDFGVDYGYTTATALAMDAAPGPPAGVDDALSLIRPVDGATDFLRIGYRRFASQPGQLWILSLRISGDGTLTPGEDLEKVVSRVEQLVVDLESLRATVAIGDLVSEVVQLSYIDSAQALDMLGAYGVTVATDPKQIPEVEFGKLPIVIQMPDPQATATGLVGTSAVKVGEFGVSLTPSLASELSENTIATPMTRLMVLYHPARPDQVSRVRTLLHETIDRPARQILVEGMVLEISDDGLRELGVEWELDEGPIQLRVGSLFADGQMDTLSFDTEDIDFHRVFTRNFNYQIAAELRALVREEKAEVLARPSVLTLNNRQSTIRVGQDIPIATSTEGTSGTANKIAFNFRYLPTGILLNIRPRINEDGSEVSMLIDTIVSAAVPGQDLEIRSQDGELLASAPTVSTRRVQTYARIQNNTPLIIGGLVSREDSVAEDKVPLLGDIPVIGALFRSERRSSTKREVIIVLTPYVIEEDDRFSRAAPRTDPRFDSTGLDLFRDAYRIRQSDVFDLGFLDRNARLADYRRRADDAIRRDHRLGDVEPYRSFANGGVPGESNLVVRMMYEVAKRLELHDRVMAERIIFFDERTVGGYNVRFLEQVLAQLGEGDDGAAFFAANPDRALAITYVSGAGEEDPIPALSLVDCPNRDAWARLLFDLNQPDADGRERSTVLIHQPEDLLRLRRAIAVKHVIDLNGRTHDRLSLAEFDEGKMLLMPDLEAGQVTVVDADVATIFYRTDQYYAALVGAIERAIAELDRLQRDRG